MCDRRWRKTRRAVRITSTIVTFLIAPESIRSMLDKRVTPDDLSTA
jgi:hypothetical protein